MTSNKDLRWYFTAFWCTITRIIKAVVKAVQCCLRKVKMLKSDWPRWRNSPTSRKAEETERLTKPIQHKSTPSTKQHLLRHNTKTRSNRPTNSRAHSITRPQCLHPQPSPRLISANTTSKKSPLARSVRSSRLTTRRFFSSPRTVFLHTMLSSTMYVSDLLVLSYINCYVELECAALFQSIDRVGWANFAFFYKKSLLEDQSWEKKTVKSSSQLYLLTPIPRASLPKALS